MTTYNPLIFGGPGAVLQAGSNGDVTWNSDAGLGGAGIDLQYMEWLDICKLAETNPAVATALEKLRTVYYLSKDDGSQT